MVDLPAFSPQQNMEPAIAVIDPGRSQIFKSNTQKVLPVRRAFVPMTGTGKPQWIASLTLTYLIGYLKLFHQITPANRLQTFFDKTS
jgi:hypothetical protein